ncbi:MAG TPA: hypothetical protein VKZ51_09315, partial [Cyclobacteriaceae bacterium]|nr:hypothetical protein [Cyclobacteriaceae bacterium]
MRFSPEQAIKVMENTGVVQVFRQADPTKGTELLDLGYSAGIRLFEYSNREENALEVFRKLSAHARQYADLILGVGSVFSDEDARQFLDAGADFIVSPVFIPTLGVYCNARQVMWVPGCGTLTEIHNAREMGAQVIKVCPGNVLGPAFVSAAKNTFPSLHFVPSGGFDSGATGLEEWMAAGAACVEMDFDKESTGDD